MPVMNGISTLKALKKMTPGSIFIMMDSFPNALLLKAKIEGAVTCINKPFNISEVINIVEQVMRNGANKGKRAQKKKKE